MPSKKHIARNFRATATLLLLLLCVCSAVAREKNNTIALPFEDSVYNFLLRRICFSASLSKHPMDVYYSPLRYRNIHRMFLHTTQYSFGISNPNMPLLRIANPQQLK